MIKVTVSILIVLLLISICAMTFTNIGSTYAEGSLNLEELCATYTEDVDVYYDKEKKIVDYENYVDNRFKVGTKSDKKNKDSKVTDEWIMEFVPQGQFVYVT